MQQTSPTPHTPIQQRSTSIKHPVSAHTLPTAAEKQAEGALSLLTARGWLSCWKQSRRRCCVVEGRVTAPAVRNADTAAELVSSW